MNILESIFLFLSKPAAAIKQMIASAFYWVTRGFGVAVANLSGKK